MRSLIAVAIIAASASAASAGTYLGLGIGTAASPSGDIPMTANDGNRSGRLMVGQSWGHLSVEGAGSRYGMLFRNSIDYQGTQLGAALKYSLPLGDQFEVFGRGGLQRTWLSTDSSGIRNWSGNGWLIGAGFEYRLNLSGVGASLFVDYERTGASLSDDSPMQNSKDEQFGLWTFGATVSL